MDDIIKHAEEITKRLSFSMVDSKPFSFSITESGTGKVKMITESQSLHPDFKSLEFKVDDLFTYFILLGERNSTCLRYIFSKDPQDVKDYFSFVRNGMIDIVRVSDSHLPKLKENMTKVLGRSDQGDGWVNESRENILSIVKKYV